MGVPTLDGASYSLSPLKRSGRKWTTDVSLTATQEKAKYIVDNDKDFGEP
jgi:hypothetical protein